MDSLDSRPLRVAFDNSLAGRNQTGTGVYASQLIRYLAQADGLDFTVLPGWGNAATGTVGRKLRALSHPIWNHAYVPWRLLRAGIDVLHAPAFTVPLYCPCASVVTIFDLDFMRHPHHFALGWSTYVNLMMPSMLRSASAVICISESTRRDVLHTFQVPESRVHVTHLGVDHARFHPGVRLDQGWAHSVGISKSYVLHVGVFSERKNIPGLLRAFARLRDQGRAEGVQLVLAGKEAPGIVGEQNIDQTILELRLRDAVLKVGHVPDEQLPGLYAGATMLAMPSLHEGFGLPVLEAMATGTPVIASNTSSLPEIAGDAAVLVPPTEDETLANAIDQVLSSSELRAQLRQKGMEQAKKFSWQRTAEQTLAIYRSLSRIRSRTSLQQT